jgi:steroid delta-isomerase-like uncharacterized protein
LFDPEAIRASIAKDGDAAGKSNTCFYRECATRTNLAVAGGRRVGQAAARKAFVQDYKSVVRRYYSEIWNAWSEPALEELLSPDIVFRGSIGTAVVGISGFKQYVDRIRSAFPDLHNHIEELIAEGDKVAAHLAYTGTHRGELFGFPGTGRKITYQGLAVFRCKEGKIVRGFVLGDTETLKRQLAQE